MKRTEWILRAARQRVVFAIFLICAVSIADAADAQRRSYTLDEDPVRLGNRALDEGRLPESKQHFQEALENEYQTARAQYGLARIAVLEGRLEDAEAFFRTALATQEREKKSYPEARAGLGLLLLRLDRSAEARLEFEQALKEKGDLWEAKYGQARILLAEGKHDAARKLLDEGASRKGRADGEDLYHHGLALFHEGKGDIAAAEREALTALNLNPSDPEYAQLVGRIYEARNAPTLAIDAYEKGLATPGTKPTAPMLHTLGGLYQKVERYNDARDRYLAAVQVDSTYAPALKDLAHLYRRARQFDRAAGVYLRYVDLENNDVEALVGLAETCLEIGRNAQALEAAQAALTLEPSREQVRLVFARAAIRGRDESKKAEASRILASRDDPKDLDPADWVALAAFQTERRQFGQATRSARNALAVDARHANAHFQLGVIELSQGHADAAVEHFQRAIGIDGKVAGFHLNLGIAQYQRQDLAKAVPEFRRALALRPDLVIGRLLLAQALAATDSIGAATQQYRRVIEAEPSNAKALRGLGYCQIRDAQYEQAAQSYQRANEIEKENADGWAGLGNAYLGLERLDDAQRAFERARSIDPQNPTMRKGMELLEQARSASGG